MQASSFAPSLRRTPSIRTNPMLKKLIIHKFKSCEETTIEFDQPLSALCGKNGVGKTTILRAIEWVAGEAVATSPTWWMTPPINEPRWIELEFLCDDARYMYSMTRLASETGPRALEELFSIRESDGRMRCLFDRRAEAIQIPETSRTISTSRTTPAATALHRAYAPG